MMVVEAYMGIDAPWYNEWELLKGHSSRVQCQILLDLVCQFGLENLPITPKTIRFQP